MGGFSVRICGEPVRRWHAGKARSLFQHLLVNRGRVVLRDTLYELLWPEQGCSRRSSSLKVAVHALRRTLAESQAPVRIDHQDFGYVLRADRIWVDAEELQAAFSSGRAAELAGNHVVAAACYERVAALHSGDFLAGDSADWIDEQREWYRSVALRALAYLRTTAVDRSDYPAAIGWSRQSLSIDRYQEEAYQALMAVHGRLGELDRVRGWYQLCARRLRDELGIAPSPETVRTLESAIGGALRGPLPSSAA
ncbi:MAG TPA: BTAD domain-containing putative transcriptional regulator [Jatrophihabitans sp.]|nr:BTAD domain-containing putative transcriptional regulator [Jatrophihabitans sp.]